MLIIKPTGGLCNNLRVMFSYYNFATSLNKKLYIIWEKTRYCNGHFLDYFKPIENITFIKKVPPEQKLFYCGVYTHKDFPNPDYSKLKLLDYMNEKVSKKINKIGNNYCAIHVRRTDHVLLAKSNNQFTSDEEFFNFCEKHLEQNIYIATDNKNTYDLFYKKFDKQIKFPYHKEINDVRRTTLEDAIIDIYMCVNSKNFMGSGYSSFSDLINILRLQN